MPKGTGGRRLTFASSITVALIAWVQCREPHTAPSVPFPKDKPARTCGAAAARAAAPDGMNVGPIDDLNPTLPYEATGVVTVPARGYGPEYCLVTGSVDSASTGKTVNFGLALPPRWNGKLLFAGCDGLCGVVFQTLPDDRKGGGFPHEALEKGYAIVATDDGHASNPPGMVLDGRWALKVPGVPDDDARADFLYRAVHTLMARTKQFVQSWYEESVHRSYFIGCSDGGREGMVEAIRHPTDFDGYIVGAPYFDLPGTILAGRAARVLLDAADAFIPSALLSRVDEAVYASCDELDGRKDGLIQNPGLCSFDPRKLACRGDATAECLTPGQVDTLLTWFSAAKDEQGRVVSLGFPVSDVYNDSALGNGLFRFAESAGPPRDRDAPEPWGDAKSEEPPGWAFFDQWLKYLVFLEPSFDSNHRSPVDRQGVVNEGALSLLEAMTDPGRGDDPAKFAAFLAADRKMILYHGYSDGFTSPFRTIQFYESWAKLLGGHERLAKNARLFMVPGMYHCNLGPGPNFFDVLGALEAWVEDRHPPEQIIATKYADDDSMHRTIRTMPLCPFPVRASYSGTGEVKRAENWSCSPNDELMKIGSNGVMAGLAAPARMRQ